MKNPVMETIMTRRAVRSYQDKPIPKDILNEIIAAGNASPSGMNVQSWRFVVVQDKKLREKLVSLSIPRLEKWLGDKAESFRDRRRKMAQEMEDPIYYGAPAIVFVIGSGNMKDYDTPMVCENMMLSARSFGLGSCWVMFGSFATEDPEIKKLLELKDDEKVFGPILLGYPKGEFPDAPPKKPPVVKWL
jgi:nitroreductase